ncbi:hypothetical protein BDQ94DRAFT_161441 [Aspergillus welwitschiae]|uniref:Uncharacterized protein n=1 Tax=Aspergillus welwitschiae TaxID=1341132 RepID=A0A3F3PVQ1_9EURO|nr:hypothetical protein BDQ94DRAFT_161441 [Aspergillus welwitschiae]RDH30426.1 hypothetical protein BDQ94DRAFT_161441 [Aspergillus welwitschiae]
MSKALKEFKNMMVREGQVSKLWKTHSPKAHIAPPKSGNKDKNWQLRLDAEEATNESLQKWREKNSSHGNLTFVAINVNEPKERMSTVSDEIWKDVEKQAKDNLG